MGRLMQCLAFMAAAFVAMSPALAAELTALRREQRIGARLQDLDYPSSLRKDLVSGLTNRLLIRIRLQHADRRLDQAAIEVATRYDLWDEVFHVTMRTPIGETSRTEPSVEAMLRFLADLRFADVFARPQNDGPLVMHADVLLNPIDRERMDMIRQWVAQNTTAAPSDANAPTRTSSAASELFARIFEQYAAGENVAAAWTRTISSRPFRLSDPLDDAR
jgi:hypothetical protein